MAMESTRNKRSSVSTTLLGPGFRFHPTDEELVWYYLRRKISGKAFRFDAISEIDIYKAEPWDLPYKSKLKTRDLEWYFFSVLDKKYGNGARTNRATGKGYWKTTGKDRTVYHNTKIVGMKKTLVYHCGRAPKGQRTNWVMHEYRLSDMELETARITQDAFVLCRVFQKSGSGPKNGEQYGAPVEEDDWDDDDLEVPEDEAIEEVGFSPDAYLNSNDIQQILLSDVPLNTAPIPQIADGSYFEETTESNESNQNYLVHAGNQNCLSNQYNNENKPTLPGSHIMEVKADNLVGIVESNQFGDSRVVDYLLDESFLDSFDNFQDFEGGAFKANDLSNPNETDTTAFDMLEEYLTFFDVNDDTPLYCANDPDRMLEQEELSDQASFPEKKLVEGTAAAILPGGQIVHQNDENATLSTKKIEYHQDFQSPFLEQASQMLGNINAPPAFAAEFPSKEAILLLNSISPSSNTMIVNNVSMIHTRNSKMVVHGKEGASRKHAKFNLVCFGFARSRNGSSCFKSSVGKLIGEIVMTLSRCWLCFVFFWIMILSMSIKIGTTYIGAK